MMKRKDFSTETCLGFLNWKLNNIKNYSENPFIKHDIKIISTTSSNRVVSGYEDNIYTNKTEHSITLNNIPISVQLYYTDKEKEEYKVKKVNLKCTINYLPQCENTNLKTSGVIINYEGQDNFLFERDKKSDNKYPYFESSIINNLFCFEGVRKVIRNKLSIQLSVFNKDNKNNGFTIQPNILRQKLIISGEEPFSTAKEFSKALDIKDLCIKINEILYSNPTIKSDLDALNKKHGPSLEDCLQYKAIVEAKVIKYIKQKKKEKKVTGPNNSVGNDSDKNSNPNSSDGQGKKRDRKKTKASFDEILEQEKNRLEAVNKNEDESLNTGFTIEKPVEDTDKVITLTNILVGTTKQNRNCIQVKLIEENFEEYSSCKELIERMQEKNEECVPNLLMFPTEMLENIIYVNINHPTYNSLYNFAREQNPDLSLDLILSKCKRVITEIVVECIFNIYSSKEIEYCIHNNKSNAQQLSEELQHIYKNIGFSYWSALDLCLIDSAKFEKVYKQIRE